MFRDERIKHTVYGFKAGINGWMHGRKQGRMDERLDGWMESRQTGVFGNQYVSIDGDSVDQMLSST